MSTGAAIRFFDRLWAHMAQAERAAGGASERWFEIAGRLLHVRLLGDALAPVVLPALRHLEIAAPGRSADLTLHGWDCASLNLEFPRSPVGQAAFTPRGEVRWVTDPRFHVAYESGGQLLSAMDRASRRAAYCVGVASDIPRFDVAEPMRAILSWFMRANGRQLLHAGAVGTRDGGVLLMGRSGAGKSNTALGTLASHLHYAADDFCAVSATGPPMVYSVYCTGKTHEQDLTRHPFLQQLAPKLDPERRDKAIYFLDETVPDKLISSFPLTAILLPRPDGDGCHLRRVPPVAALRASAPDTARLLPDAGSEVLRCLARLVRSVPCYELCLGSRPDAIPGVIAGLLSGEGRVP